MKSLPTLLNTLQSSYYLAVRSGKENAVFFDLLSNGRLYCDYLKQQWQRSETDGLQTHYIKPVNIDIESTNNSNRLDFLQSERFLSNLRDLRLTMPVQCPSIIKTEDRIWTPVITHENNLLHFLPENKQYATRLVTYYFFHAACGLSKFYNIQRERKIWWMRFSANPSRYYLEPFVLKMQNQKLLNLGSNCQSVTIKSRFNFGAPSVEHITLVALWNSSTIRNNEDFALIEMNTGERVLPAIIRCEIDLEIAASAMFLDSCDHGRQNTLLLNRKLAPFQCAVICHRKDKSLKDLRDLCDHLSFVLRRSNLRVYNSNIFTNAETQLVAEFNTTDRLGIPYVLIIEEETLGTGLLKLRCRDTALFETIHISDIPEYVLNIFLK